MIHYGLIKASKSNNPSGATIFMALRAATFGWKFCKITIKFSAIKRIKKESHQHRSVWMHTEMCWWIHHPSSLVNAENNSDPFYCCYQSRAGGVGVLESKFHMLMLINGQNQVELNFVLATKRSFVHLAQPQRYYSRIVRRVKWRRAIWEGIPRTSRLWSPFAACTCPTSQICT